jgi:hypothetical protein
VKIFVEQLFQGFNYKAFNPMGFLLGVTLKFISYVHPRFDSSIVAIVIKRRTLQGHQVLQDCRK